MSFTDPGVPSLRPGHNFLVPETKGRSLEEMDQVFGDNSGQEEKEILKANAAQARSAGNPIHHV
jgi:hypothetical protein